jgi:plasmid stabilization system protein ParE
MTIGNVVEITATNADECERALENLRDHLDTLARMTERYPVECSFGGYRFVFTSRVDITTLISVLGSKLASYRGVTVPVVLAVPRHTIN